MKSACESGDGIQSLITANFVGLISMVQNDVSGFAWDRSSIRDPSCINQTLA
jgi:hypothetical protein